MILGIDPGARDTGFCLLDAAYNVKAGMTISREDEDWSGYIKELLDTLVELLEDGVASIVIEEVTKPKAFFKGKKQILPVDGVMGTSRVFGAIEMFLAMRDHNFVVIPPGGNGSGDLRSYPPELVGPRETTGTGGILRHVRSAYDVAKVGSRISTPVEAKQHIADIRSERAR